METPVAGSRIDKWLWAARFYRTRTLAGAAVTGGKVHVNGQRVKASRPLRIGDSLVINRNRVEFEIVVEGLSERRGPAPEARQLYRETDESRQRREQVAEERRLHGGRAPAPVQRPNKRDRRLLIRLRNSRVG
jgi:ribosome-associated heat shock protein Hsp15